MQPDYKKPDPGIRFGIALLRSILASPLGLRLIQRGNQLEQQAAHGWVETVQVSLTLPRLPAAFAGYRLVHISDFHIDTWLGRERLLDAIGIVNANQPDCVAITGDFVTNHPEATAADLIDCLRQISAPDGVYAVLGNHDHWSDASIVRQVLQDAGVIELPNQVRRIVRGSAALAIAGVDDLMVEKADLPAIVAQLDLDECAILLAHEPDFADQSAPTRRFDLQLSGHTHGGQIHLPILGMPILPRFGRKYPSGLYSIQSMYVYTNRGLGTADLQVRYNCPPEITVFEFNPPANTTGSDSF